MIQPVEPTRGGGEGGHGGRYVLRLFVSAGTERSRRAVDDVRRMCEERLAGRYELQVVDVTQSPGLAGESEVYATPALVREQPAPTRRFFGDFSDAHALAAGLGLHDAPGAEEPGADAGRARGSGVAGDAGRAGDRSETAP